MFHCHKHVVNGAQMLAEPGIHEYSLNRKYSKQSDKELKILQKNFNQQF
jgi:hypothetical protein